MTATSSSSTVTISDGTEIPIDWVYSDAPQYEWMLEREHWPGAMTPMEAWIWRNAWPGADRAWDEINLEPPVVFSRFQLLGPFLYVRVTMPPPEQMAALLPRYLAVAQEHGNALSLWKNYCEPRIKRSCDEIAASSPAADPQTVSELLFYGFHQTFTCVGLLFLPNMRLSAMLTEFNVPDAELTGFELTQGDANATQAIDEEIWELAELARATPSVASALRSSDEDVLSALRGDPAAAAFVAAFDALIERHARRSQGWALTQETWGERPEAALALVRAQVGAEHVSPDELRERTARRREEAMVRVLGAVPAERHEELRGILRELEGYVNIREGRAYWQLVITGAMRGWLLGLGAELVESGRIDRADDIFFVTPDDGLADAASDLRPLVAARRAELDRWRKVDPPLVIGTPGDVLAEAEAKRAEFRGRPASRGTVTGRVRILRSVEEGPRLERGDILVCAMTTPAWTPLFAIAGGIVTETGGALSHPAITAREYGIPAVVALADATTKLKDGDVVTVDGAAGTVSIGA
jgi:pyruvate,water dikinase